MSLLLIPAATAMAATYMPVSQAIVASRSVGITTNASTSWAILFSVTFTPIAVHSPFLHSCIKTIFLKFVFII